VKLLSRQVVIASATLGSSLSISCPANMDLRPLRVPPEKSGSATGTPCSLRHVAKVSTWSCSSISSSVDRGCAKLASASNPRHLPIASRVLGSCQLKLGSWLSLVKKSRKSTEPSALTSGSDTLKPSSRRQAANSDVRSSSGFGGDCLRNCCLSGCGRNGICCDRCGRRLNWSLRDLLDGGSLRWHRFRVFNSGYTGRRGRATPNQERKQYNQHSIEAYRAGYAREGRCVHVFFLF
jgi:hypothetical protein